MEQKALIIILAAIDRWFTAICVKDGRGRTGGYLCVAYKGVVLGTFKIGGPFGPKDDWASWLKNCQEKVMRLLANPGTSSAYQTRDSENGKYGGGVQLGDWTLGFSGLSEIHDENVCLIGLTSVYGKLPDEFLDLIVQCSQNSYRGVFWG